MLKTEKGYLQYIYKMKYFFLLFIEINIFLNLFNQLKTRENEKKESLKINDGKRI